jgi:O-antigen/teichoic acid export membrane protein
VQTGLLWYASRWRPALAWPMSRSIEFLRFGMMISAGSLLWFVYSNSDFAVISALLGPDILGHYSLAFQLISIPVQKLSTTVNQVAFAAFCRIQDDPERMRRWFAQLVLLLTLISAPAMIGMALVADDAIPILLGSQWTPAVLPFRILAPVGVIMVVSYSTPPLFNALGRPEINVRFTGLLTALFPASFAVAGWFGGLIGICLVWAILYPLVVAGLLYLTRSITGISLGDLLRTLAPVLLGVVAMTAAVLLVRQLGAWTEPSAVRLIVSIATGAIVFSAWIWLTARTTVVPSVILLVRELRGKARGEAPCTT